MFENGILTKLELPCQHHPKFRVTSVCTDPQCLNAPLLCGNCLNEFDFKGKHLYHENNLRNLWEGLSQLSASIERDRPAMQNLYSQTVGKKENEQLVRWQEEKQRHAHSIENHIKSIKYQIEEETKIIETLFEQALTESKELLFRDLDTYYRTYKENFEIFSKIIDPLIGYNQSHKYYSNFNNVVMKVYTEPKKRANDFLLEVKNIMTFTQKISAGPKAFEELLDRATTYMNAMIDSLPTVEFDEEKTLKTVKFMSMEIIKSSLKICDLKSLNLILNATEDDKRNPGKQRIFEDRAVLARKNSNRA